MDKNEEMAKKKKKISHKEAISFSSYVIKNARKLDLFRCWRSDINTGIANFVVARQRKNGTLLVGVYLIDMYCLGLKDTFYAEFDDLEDLEVKFLNAHKPVLDFEEITPNLCFNSIYGAIEYAEDIGFNPHKEFKITEYILDDVEDIEFEDIEFGFKGKPLFVAGENDNAARILTILDKTVGHGNYDYIIEGETFEEDEDDEEEEYYEQMQDLRDLSDGEFEEETSNSVFNYSEEVRPLYAAFLLVHLALRSWKTYEKFEKEYKNNPQQCLDKVIKYLILKLPPGFIDVRLIRKFSIVSIENTLQFEGPEFFLLKDFQTAFEAFELEDQLEYFEEILTFMIPFEYKRILAIQAIRDSVSEKLFQEANFNKLNSFQKNRVADEIIEIVVKYDLESLILKQFNELVNTLDDYLELAQHLPDLSQAELKKLILEAEIPDEDE